MDPRVLEERIVEGGLDRLNGLVVFQDLAKELGRQPLLQPFAPGYQRLPWKLPSPRLAQRLIGRCWKIGRPPRPWDDPHSHF